MKSKNPSKWTKLDKTRQLKLFSSKNLLNLRKTKMDKNGQGE